MSTTSNAINTGINAISNVSTTTSSTSSSFVHRAGRQ